MGAGDGGGGGHQGFAGDYEAMQKIATTVDDLGNAVVELAGYAADASASVRENHAGWAVSRAMESAQAECEFNIKGFGRWMCDLGDGLKKAIGTYQGADNDAVNKLVVAGGSE